MIVSAIWLPSTLLAALFQSWRTAVQLRLRAQLTVSGAGLVRYVYGAPVGLVLLLGYSLATGAGWPEIDGTFLVLATAGGVAQILGTNLLIMAFGYRNFVVGTAFSKTETVQAALFAWLFLGERLSVPAIAGIGVGLAGVALLTLGGKRLSLRETLGAIGQPAALCGLAAGGLFALTGVCVKRATIELGYADPIRGSLTTLLTVMLLQSVIHGAYIALREPATLGQVAATWRTSGQVGILAALGSAGWFTGFATAPVALVRLVGQVEVLFTLGFSRLYLGEHIKRHEAVGLLLVAAGVGLALLGQVFPVRL
ncbi:MAG TPA: EamA family transporter [Stellaceae bacterium]|nr:EamA family transporter [Stellaceae bacterium]